LEKADWIKSLLMQNEKRLLRYAQKWVSREAALDIVQETFLRLLKENQKDLEGYEVQWLFRVCRNLAFDFRKKDMGMLRTDLNSIASTAATQDENVERAQTNSQVQDAVQRLNETQQEVIRLKFEEGFSYKEISTITGHSISYIGVLIHEAMKILKAELQPATSQLKGERR
jgi:RNA polymerase sigma factor (sigma-70 family)